MVDVNDLLAVINGWGPCPSPPTPCPGDVAPAGGDGQVNVNDLLEVINYWGPGCGSGPAAAMPRNVHDCMNLYSDDLETLNKCLEAVRQLELRGLE